MFAGQLVEGLYLYLVFVTVPKSHSAFVVTIALHLATGCLRNRLTTVLADHLVNAGRMALQMRFDGVGR